MEETTQKKSSGTWLWIILAAIIVVGGYFIMKKGPAPADTSKEPIKIGFIGSLTGDAAVYGEPLRNMTQLAVEEINRTGGIKGQPLEVIYEDGKCSGKDAASAMEKLVSVDKVKIVLGGFCSSESLAAAPIATANKVLLFSPGSSSPDLTHASPFFFRDYPSDASQGKVLAEVAYNDKQWKNIAFIQEQQDYPLGVFKAFQATFEALGGKITKQEFAPGATDFRSIIGKVKAEKPDALFLSVQTPAAADRILKQIKEAKWTVPLLLSDAVSGDPETIQRNAEVLEGAFAAEFGIDPANPKFKQMMEAYKAKFGSEPPYQSYAQTEYDAVYILRDAIQEVGYDGEKVAEWLKTLKDWEGASGKVTLGADGDRVGGHVPKVVKGGKVELYVK